jgi:hypothetical protein
MLLEPNTVGRDGSARECSQADGAAASAVLGLQGAVLLPDREVAVVVRRRSIYTGDSKTAVVLFTTVIEFGGSAVVDSARGRGDGHGLETGCLALQNIGAMKFEETRQPLLPAGSESHYACTTARLVSGQVHPFHSRGPRRSLVILELLPVQHVLL